MSDRTPWNIGMGLPQIFRIDDIVRVRQDGSAPREWCADWANIQLHIIGTRVDEHRPGRVAYYVKEPQQPDRMAELFAEDWLEKAS